MKTTLMLLIAGLAGFAGTANAQEYCREFTQPVQVGGRTQEAYGTACRQSDGSWAIQTPAQTEEQMMGQVEAVPSAVEYAQAPQPIYIEQQPVYIERQPMYVEPQPSFYGGIVIGNDRHYHRHRSRWEPRYGHHHHW